MIQGYRSDMYKIWFVVLAEIYQKIREPLNFEDSLENSFEWVWTMTLRIHDYSSDYLLSSIISIASTICSQISSLVGRLMIIFDRNLFVFCSAHSMRKIQILTKIPLFC